MNFVARMYVCMYGFHTEQQQNLQSITQKQDIYIYLCIRRDGKRTESR